MVKFVLLILSFGLSTLTTLLLHFDEAWKTAVCIVGLGLAYIALIVFLYFMFAVVATLTISRKKAPAKYGAFYRKLFNLDGLILLSLFGVKLTVNGLDKIPTDDNFVLFQNHLSNVDPIFTSYILRKFPLIFVSKASLFKIPFFGKTIQGIGYVKLTRKAGMNDTSEIIRGLRWVRAGECSLAVYPEGTRNKTYPDPVLLDFKEQILGIAQKAEKPIVISAIHGTDKINDKLLFKVHNIQIDILDVIKPEEYANLTQEELSDKVRKIMLDGINNPLKTKEKGRLY